MIHLYAFVADLGGLPDRRGVNDAKLEQVPAGDLGAVVSRHFGPLRGDPRAAAATHGLVVEALCTTAAAVLPARFGETSASDAELRETVSARAEGIRTALELVRGCVEVGIRLARAAAPVTAPSGRAYLEARLAESSTVAALDERLRPFTRASRTSGGERTYLVERAAAGDALDAARAFAEVHPELSLVCTGPWAPYSFCEVGA